MSRNVPASPTSQHSMRLRPRRAVENLNPVNDDVPSPDDDDEGVTMDAQLDRYDSMRANTREAVAGSIHQALVTVMEGFHRFDNSLTSMEGSFDRIENSLTSMSHNLESISRRSLETAITMAQTFNIMCRTGDALYPFKTVLLPDGREPTQMGLPLLRTVEDIRQLTLPTAKKYYELYQLSNTPRLETVQEFRGAIASHIGCNSPL